MDTLPLSRDFLTIQELSKRSGRSVNSLRRDVDAGKIEAYQPGGPGGKLLFRPDALERCKARAHEPHPQTPPRPKHLPGRRPRWTTEPPPSPLSP